MGECDDGQKDNGSFCDTDGNAGGFCRDSGSPFCCDAERAYEFRVYQRRRDRCLCDIFSAGRILYGTA